MMKRFILSMMLGSLLSGAAFSQTYNPVAYWTFDGTQYFNDQTGNYVLANQNPYYAISGNGQVGQFCSVFDFNNNLGTSSFSGSTTALSIEWLFKPGDDFKQTVLLVNPSFDLTLNHEEMNFTTNPKLVIALDATGQRSWDYYNDGNWHHMAVTLDAVGDTFRLFVDGVLVQQLDTPVNLYAGTNFKIVRSTTGTVHLDEVAVYNSVLSPSIIYQHYLEMQQGKHYSNTDTLTVALPPPAAFNTAVDSSEYVFDGGVSALTQLQSFPLPRYKPGHTLMRNFPWWNYKYLSGFEGGYTVKSTAITNSLEMQKELSSARWNYYLDLGVSRDMMFSDSVGGFSANFIQLAGDSSHIPTSLITNWSQTFPADAGYTSANNYVQSTSLPDSYYIDTIAPNNDGIGKVALLSPECPLDSISLDGKTQRKYLEKFVSRLSKKIHFINDNDEVVLLTKDSVLLQKDAVVNAAQNASGLSWESYIARQANRIKNSYRNEFMDSLPQLDSTLFSFYKIDGNPIAGYRYSEERNIQTLINGQSYATPDFYPNSPGNWEVVDGGGSRHGWQWIADSRKVEIAAGDSLYSPFVSAGWETNPSLNIAPAQWLGLLKALSVSGAEFFYASFFSIFPRPETYAWQMAIPSYAQAIASRYENILRNGTLLEGDGNYAFSAGDPRVLIVARKLGNQYILSGTLQPQSNVQGNTLLEKTATINLEGEQLTFRIRRQGSTYYYDKATKVFYQLDGWHEAAQPYYWSKDFVLEAELYDALTNSSIAINTQQECTGNSGDYTHFTAYLSGFNGSSEAQYHFTPRNFTDSTYHVWIRARSKDSTAQNVTVKVNAVSKTLSGIQHNEFNWYLLPDSFVNLNNGQEYTFSLQPGSQMEVDKTVLTTDENKVFADTPFFVNIVKVIPGCQSQFGIIHAHVCGGVPPYQYQLDNGPFQNEEVFKNLASGVYLLKVKDNNGTIAASTIGLTDPVAYDYVNGDTLKGTVAWNTDTEVKGQVVIAKGAVLSINNATAKFSYAVGQICPASAEVARIVIMPGGKLVLNNARLTGGSCAGGIWDGIYVLGDASASQSLSAQGVMEANNSVIENALFIRVGKYIDFCTDFNPVYHYPGGIITANRSIFSNIREGVLLDNTGYLYGSASNFDSSLFLFNHSGPWPTPSGAMVNLFEIDSVRFSDNTFIGDAPLPAPQRGTAITGFNAGFKIERPNSTGGNYFLHFNKGVDARYSSPADRKVQVLTNNFLNVQHGIYIQGGQGDIIYNNQLLDIPAADAQSGDTYGIFTVGCGNTTVQGNTFKGAERGGLAPSRIPNSNPASYGIVVENNSNKSSWTFNNTFGDASAFVPDLDYHVQTQYNNGVLKVTCNNFISPGTISWVTFDNLKQQGKNCDLNSGNTNQAGNEFKNSCEITLNDIYVDTDTFKYFSHDGTQTYPTKPLCSGNQWAYVDSSLKVCIGVFKTAQSCPDTAAGIVGPPDGDCNSYLQNIRQQIHELETEINGAKAQLRRTDGGNTRELIEMINQEPPMSAIHLTDKLMASLPLSEHALFALLHRKYPLPPEMTERILVENSRLPDHIMLELREHPLPPPNMQRVEAAQNKPLFLRTSELQALITYDESELNYLQYLEQEALKVCEGKNRAKEQLRESRSLEDKKQLADILLNENDFTGAREMVSAVAFMTDTAIWWMDTAGQSGTRQESENFCKFLNCLIDASKDGKKIIVTDGEGRKTTDLSESQVQIINEVAGSNTHVSAQAEALLMQISDDYFEHPFKKIDPDKFAAKREKVTEPYQFKSVTEMFFHIVPNPASDQIFIETNYPNSKVWFYDIMGRRLKQVELDNNKSVLGISTWPSGVYLYELRSGTSIERGKLIIAR